MSGLRGAARAARRCAAWLVPAGRREWAKALWTEADEAPPGWQRLAWRAGGLRLIAREPLTRRRARRMLLFAEAAALMARATWRGAPGDPAAAFARVDVIATILLLTVLPVLSRWLFGPARASRAARVIRVSAYAAVLVLMPAKAAVEQFAFTVPRNIHERRLFSPISGPPGPNPDYGIGEIVFLVVIACYLMAIFWITSRRSSVTPATMAIGAGGGVLFGVVMYSVTPLGVNKYATNPWLPGSDVDPLVVLAWILLFGVPVAAAILAGRRHPGPADSGPFRKTKFAPGHRGGAPGEPVRRADRHRSRHGHGRADAARDVAADPVRPRPPPERGRRLQPRDRRRHERPGIPAHVGGLPGHRAVHEHDGRRGRMGKAVRGRTRAARREVAGPASPARRPIGRTAVGGWRQMAAWRG